MSMAFFSTRSGQFTYFALQLGEFMWRGKDVLDFGGNIGNILRDPNSTIDPERYWCIDVVKDAVEKGKRLYANSHWLFYNRYCFFFNPYGIPHLKLPDIEQRFDYIVAYSVFSNTSRTDMIELVGELRNLLKSGGALAFSFIDPHYHSWPDEYDGNNLQYRLKRIKAEENPDVDTETIMKKARHAEWCLLVNDADLYVETEEIEPCPPEQQKSCHVFYTAEYMKSLFPNATILPPVNGEMQHCCIIKASDEMTV
jgi:SAM-dependent methyltransferase